MPMPGKPSSQPAMAPGVALRTTSTSAEGTCCFMLLANSALENSRPRVSRSSTTPIGAPVLMNTLASVTGTMPPLPSHSPASRYSGIGDRAKRRATAPSSASAVRTAPSCKSSGAEICTRSAFLDELLHAADTGLGAHDDQHVLGTQQFGGPRRSEHLVVSHDRHDRCAGPGSGLGVPQRPVHEDAARQDVHLAGLQPRYLLGQLGEAFGDARCAQDLRDRICLLVGEPKDRAGLVGVVAAVQHHVEVTAPPRHDPDPLTVVAGELVTHAQAGQQDFFDVHRTSVAWAWSAYLAAGRPRVARVACR